MSQDTGASGSTRSALEELRSLRIEREAPVQASGASGRIRWGRWVLLSMLLVGLVMAAPSLMRWYEARTAPPPETQIVVRTGGPQIVLTSTGYVNADAIVLVGSTIFGRLEKIHVQKGDLVKKGQILAELESDQLRAELALSRANLKRDQRNLERQEKLAASNATTQEALDNARSGVEANRASVELAAAKLRQVRILSPIDGKVLERIVEPGIIVTPNQTTGILKLADMTKSVVEVDIKEGDLAKLEIGQRAEVVLDAFPSRPYAGSLREFAQVADRAKATVLGKVFLDDPDDAVRPGMSARVTFRPKQNNPDPNAGKLLIPSKALLSGAGAGPGDNAVFVVLAGRLEKRTVEVRPLPKDSDQVEVIRGLEDGERIVTGAKENLRAGQTIKAASEGEQK